MTSIFDKIANVVWLWEKNPETKDNIDNQPKAPVSTETKLDNLVPATQKSVAEKKEWIETKEQLRALERERNRATKLASIKSSESVKALEIKEDENMDSIKAKKLLQIEKDNSWFLSSVFAYKQTTDKDWNIVEIPLEQKDVNEWDKILIDFWKNSWAYWKVGAWDIIPENIKTVKIKDDKWVERVWIRWIKWSKVWYYDDNWYIPIFTWYTITVCSKSESQEIVSKSAWKMEFENTSEKEAREKYIALLWNEDGRESRIRAMNIEKNKEFKRQATEIAKELEKTYWIPWQVTYWQACLESANWNSWLAQKSNNLFWIKWKGRTYATNEYFDWTKVTINDSFKEYADIRESFLDYAKLLTQNPRYKQAFKYAANINPRPEYYPSDYNENDYDPEKFVDTVIKSWYATDPRYTAKIVAMWKGEDLKMEMA